jgi:hypothetical protein
MTDLPRSPAEAVTHLEALAAELAARGWPARLDAPPGRLPSLHAANPEPGAAALAEYIYAAPVADGTWRYWWPWAGSPLLENGGPSRPS